MEDQPVPAPPETPTSPPVPIMDIKAPPPASEPSPVAPAPPPDSSSAKQPSAPPATPKKPLQKPAAKGVTVAIIATVIIVLGLAGLAVYAYIKTK